MRGGAARRLFGGESCDPGPRGRACLVVVSGPAEGQRLELGRRQMLIGRGPEADLVLADASLSKLHALFLQTERGHEVQDLESANGTWVNGVRTEIAELEPGDRIALGEHLLRYVVEPVG